METSSTSNQASPDSSADIESRILACLVASEHGAVAAIDVIIEQAVKDRASDFYLEPRMSHVDLRFRLDGALYSIARLPKDSHERLVARLKVLGHLPTYHRGLPQDGRVDVLVSDKSVSFRISVLPTIHGEQVVLRALNSSSNVLLLDGLGFSTEVNDGLRRLVSEPHGTFLLTGPSSSGKTTTIYALLQELLQVTDRHHIVTVEDPVEYRLDGISQSQVDSAAGYGYEEALKAILRQDPEVIAIGEIRDPETALMAIRAGLTGHLVLSTIHSGTAAGVICRLLDMGVEPYLLVSSLRGSLAQRLIRKNCLSCIEEYTPAPQLLKRGGIDAGTGFKRGAGCELCRGTGFVGRTGVGELLLVSETISQLILERRRTSELHGTATAEGMLPLHTLAMELAIEGITTVEEAMLNFSMA